MENQQELMQKLNMYEQQMNQMNQQLGAINQNIFDIHFMKDGLEELKGAKGQDILAPLGKGIFVQSKVNHEDLIVDIGENNLVKKSIEETKEIMEDQLKKLAEVKEELEGQVASIQQTVQKMFMAEQAKISQ